MKDKKLTSKNSMTFNIGLFSNNSTIEVTNRQSNVEYRVVSGFCDEKDARSAVGNYWRDAYSTYYSGWYSERAATVKRLEDLITETESKLNELKFALKVTKKKTWVKV